MTSLQMSSPPPLPETILKATPNGPITAYDPYTGTVLARYNGSQCPRNGITIIGDHQFASSHVSPETGTGSIHLYYWWSPSFTLYIPLPEPVAPLAATADGSYIFSGGVSGRIHSVTLPSGDLIRSFSVHRKPISCITINSDGSLVISGSEDGTIAVTPIVVLLDSSIDANSKSCKIKRLAGHELPVTGLVTGMGRSDGIMVSSSLDWTCKVWNVVTGAHLETIGNPGEIWSMVLDPLESELYTGGTDGVIYKRKLKVDTTKEAARGGATVVWGGVHDRAIVAMAMLNYGNVLLTVTEDGKIYSWDADSGKMLGGFVERVGDGVSGVVVVKCGGGFGTRVIENGESGGYGGGEEVGKAVKKMLEMEEAVKVVADDRGRAISDLESAIKINEKLLNLMLQEADAISKFETLT